MKTYEIAGAMIDTLDIFLDSDRQEADKETYKDVMEYLKEELQNKGTNILKYIRNLELEAISVKTEIERLEDVKKNRENKVKSLKGYLKNILILLDKKKIETELGNYNLRKSSKVEIIDISKLPEECLRIKQEISPDKALIAQKMKNGEEIAGAVIVEDYNLLIK